MNEVIEFEKFTREELRALAGAMCEDKTVAAILGRVGVHGDLTPKEEQFVEEFIDRFKEEHGWGTRDPWLCWVAVALARKITAGDFAGPEDAGAQAFVEDRFVERSTFPGGYLCNNPTQEEVLLFAQEVYANEKYRAMVPEFATQPITLF